jgi:hypothetical protein
MLKYFPPRPSKHPQNYFNTTNAVINAYILDHNLDIDRDKDELFRYEYMDMGDLSLLNKIHKNNIYTFEKLSQSQKKIFMNFIDGTVSNSTQILLVD